MMISRVNSGPCKNERRVKRTTSVSLSRSIDKVQ